MKKSTFCILALLLLAAACNKDDLITEEVKQPPVIELDSDTGIYTIKVGRQLTIAPTYKFADDALYAWTSDGKLISSEPTLHYAWEQVQELYLKLRVDTPDGYAEEELKVDVLELAPPAISLAIPSKGLKVMRSTEYIFNPDIRNDDLDDFKMEWIRTGRSSAPTELTHSAKRNSAPTRLRSGLPTSTVRPFARSTWKWWKPCLTKYGSRHLPTRKLPRIAIRSPGAPSICAPRWNTSIIRSTAGA